MRFMSYDLSVTTIAGIASLLLLLYYTASAVRNVFFHPLSKYPGPRVAAVSRIPWLFYTMRGRLPHWVKHLHDKYDSDVIRICPDELSFINPSAWKDIHGSRPGHLAPEKNPGVYSMPSNGTASLVTADRENHARMRKVLSHAFSDRATREYEPVIETYVATLINRLRQQVSGPPHGKVDISDWMRYLAFDIAGDLSFGESFGCLRNEQLHPWAHMIPEFLKADICLAAYDRFPLLRPFANYLIGNETISAADTHFAASGEKANQRIDLGVHRADLMTPILKHNEKGKGLTRNEIKSNASVFIVAGSDTSATVLTGTFFYLLKNPDCLQKVTEEVRNTFKNDLDINAQSAGHLPYTLACLDETHRIYPTILTGQAVVVPTGGDLIGDTWLPEGTGLSIQMYAAYRSSRNFRDPYEYRPERWLEDARYLADKREVFQPFSHGSRNCIGKNIGIAETRLVLARILWNFDLELCEETDEDWLDQRAYVTWQRKPLLVRLRPRREAF